MLSRLADLRAEAADASVSVKADFDDEEADQQDAAEVAEPVEGAWVPPDETRELTPEEELEYLEFLEEMHDLYHELLADDGAVVQALAEIRHHVDNMDETILEEKEALLPTKISQMSNRFEGQELVCQRMINRAKGTLETLKTRQAEVDTEKKPEAPSGWRSWFSGKERLVESAPAYMEPVRQAMASLRSAEYKELVRRFFNARSAVKHEVSMRTQRQLRFAFPEAKEYEFDQVMEFPESAITAVALRLEKGDRITLEQFIQVAESDPEKENQRRLEQGAKELKLLMLQFSELIDNQGEMLDAIESNIKQVLQDTTEAIDTLAQAVEYKRTYEKNMRRMKICCGCCFMFMILLVIQYIRKTYHHVVNIPTSMVQIEYPAPVTKTSTDLQKLHRVLTEGKAFSRRSKLPGQRFLEGARDVGGFVQPAKSLVGDALFVENAPISGVTLTATGHGIKKRQGHLHPD